MNIFHYKNKSGEYKSFNIYPTDDNNAVFVTIAEGVKNGKRDSIATRLNRQELAYLIIEGQKIYNSLEEEKNDYKSED